MKKAITFILILAVLGGSFFYCMRAGLIDQWFPGVLEKVIPGYQSAPEPGERVSSDSADAVFVDNVGMLAGLGSGTGLIERFAGSVEPQETREYKLEGERTVKECYVKEGDEVKKGQKLFTYDTSKDESDLEQAQIELERAKLSQDTSEARAELEKQKASANTEAKKLQVLVTENEIKRQERAQKAKQKESDALKEKIENATITSDIDGVIKSIQESNSESDFMDSGDSAYITILKTGTYRIKASANEQNIASIFEGERVLVFSRVDPEQHWAGSISEIKRDQGNDSENSNNGGYYGMESSSGSTDYPFYVELEHSDNLMLGQHVYLEQDLGQADAKDGLWLYDYYLAEESDGSRYVWAASDSNTLEKRSVEVGAYDEDTETYEILSGLTADDYICEPQDDLVEGLPVAYNDPSGYAETESMFTWDMADQEGDLEEDWGDMEFDTEDGWYYEGEDFDMYDYDDEFFDDEYYDDFDDEDYETEEDGTIIIE